MSNSLFPEAALFALLTIPFAALILRRLARPHRRRHRRRSRHGTEFSRWPSPATIHPIPLPAAPPATAGKAPAAPDLRDPAQQMHAIARVEFESTPLLNRKEARLLPLLESAARDLRAGHRVMAQTSLGELIRPRADSATPDDRSAAFASINSKRLDFAIIDRAGHLALAVEYQGEGHHQGTAFMRDAVKREALRRAGIPLIEVDPDFDPGLLRQRVRGHLAPATDPAAETATVTALGSRRP
ncbi:MAG: DUF2726 domain-containing protein [Paracoccaceae bacterium]